MPDQQSDFSERLKAMREGRSGASAQQPSLRDRLQQGAPPVSRSDNSAAKADMRAKIQSKFQQKKLEPEIQAPGSTSAPAAAATPSAPLEKPIEFEMGKLPEQKQKKENKSETWNPENGGTCPSCGAYNLAHVAFCGNCDYMLIRSEVVIEVVTSYPITEIRGLVKTFVEKLHKLNIKTTEDLLRVGISHKNRQMLIKHTGLSERSLMRMLHQADLCRIPSMTPEHTSMLELLGIYTLEDLLKHKPIELYNKIQQNKIKLNQNHIVFLPTKNAVNVWLEEGKELVPLKL